MKYEKLLPRFLDYVKVNTRSDENSTTVPSVPALVDFAHKMADEMREIGIQDVHYLESNGYVVGTIPATTDKNVRKIGLISHMDTADFNAEGINPQILENYDGESVIKLGDSGFSLDPAEFPNLKNYKGQTLIHTDGTTLLGADDKSGIAEIMTLADYLININPDFEHGEIRIGFGPDEEIGTGADRFDVEDFNVDFAYTVDGGPLGELEYETFSAAGAVLEFQGKNVHPGTAKNTMVNALQLAMDYHAQLPEFDRPEKTEGREGFFHLLKLDGTVEEARAQYIIRDHAKDKFNERKALMQEIANKMNAELGSERVKATIKDQYYNMAQVIEKDMSIIDLAEEAMKNLDIEPKIEPVRGGTDGSKISFMGLPTPNIFAGGENMHGRFEFVSLQTMEKAVDVLLEMLKLNNKVEK
ncbi:peptidase T [Lactococcus formosensis]|uniref:peptidase T n=1 Tax=Lactococcus formosensis TaxID=1281486 RepID=UPI00030B905B|nr:peptidase T [Lactococcus formosensis]MCH1723192.1 peptidase T [Lactococcus formosensis]MDG6112917.1 peptidase T [Lactococcus formosensis]MDG6115073.1 peptidase T [Lactococcus formosensis]MDG6121224.1 peptidase T [Lactococcus formosensis]MDG6124711.1 peptidase T [Lactococcus formosensis]